MQITTDISVRLTRTTSNTPPYNSFELVVRDRRSGSEFIRATLDSEQFANLVSGSGDGAIIHDVTLRGVDILGMRHEVKTEVIKVPVGGGIRRNDEFMDLVRQGCREFEVDGWEASAYDLKGFNSHRVTRDNEAKVDRYRVSFHRYVEWVDEPSDD